VQNAIEALIPVVDPRREGDPPRAVLVSRLIPQKRVDRFLEALARARREVPALRGLVVGDGPERGPLERKAEELGVRAAVEFLGVRDDVRPLLSASDVLVLSSDDEGFPNVVLEAMEASRPVIATDVGDVRDVVRDGETGWVVPPAAEVLAERLVRIARDPALARRMGVAGRTRLETRYGLAVLASNLLGVYRDLAGKEGHARVRAAFA
jgi:glycosyltransferase involved in cell wall biosynthesis